MSSTGSPGNADSANLGARGRRHVTFIGSLATHDHDHISRSVSREAALRDRDEPGPLQSPSAVVHLEYDDVRTVPPKPSEGNWTRFICLSDTHRHTFPVPDGDVLLHSGDLTCTGTVSEFEITLKWLYNLPHPVKM
jgi:hypothetical protein